MSEPYPLLSQCPFITPHGFDDGYLNCAKETGHDGPHADSYEVHGAVTWPDPDTREWYVPAPSKLRCATCEEFSQLFELQQKRMNEATKLWQEATGRHDVLPDLGDLLTWLMQRRATS